MLNLETYFTAGEKEVRAWTITKGMKAQQAAMDFSMIFKH